MRPPRQHRVKDRYGHAAHEERRQLAGDERDRQPLENRVEQNDRRTGNDGERGQQHRPEANRSRVDDGFVERHAFTRARLDEVDQDDRVSHDPGTRHEADHGRGCEKGSYRGVRRLERV
jgi:hypothetical protein